MKACIRAAAACAMAMGLAGSAQADAVQIELALMIDVSSSISDAEFQRQRSGWSDGLQTDLFMQAYLRLQRAVPGPEGPWPLAVGTYLFADNVVQQVGWTILRGTGDPLALAHEIGRIARPAASLPALGGGRLGADTNLAEALDRARLGMEGNGIESRRRVVAISSDGTQNTTRDGDHHCDEPECTAIMDAARADALAAELSIHAVLMPEVAFELFPYYRSHVASDDGWLAYGSQAIDFGRILAHAIQMPSDTGPGMLPEPGSLALGLLGLLALLAPGGRHLQRPRGRGLLAGAAGADSHRLGHLGAAHAL